MLEIGTNREITESTDSNEPERLVLPLRGLKREPHHWTRQLPDPLGKALLRLQSNRDVLDDVAAAVDCLPTAACPTTDPQPDALLLPKIAESSEIAGIPAERRRFSRRRSECAVTLLSRNDTHELTPRQIDGLLEVGRTAGKLVDISSNGLCVLLETEFVEESEVVLRISNPRLGRHVDATARVVKCRQAGRGQYTLHCHVEREFSLDQLQDLGRPLLAGHALA